MRRILTLTLALTLPFAARSALPTVSAQQGPAAGGTGSGALTVTPVQGNVYMISGAGPNNLTVQIGRYGPVLVDTPPPALMPQVLAEIRKLSPLPFHLLLHTTGSHDFTSGDAALLASSRVREAWVHNNLYAFLLGSSTGPVALPESTITYAERVVDNFNGEGIVINQVDPAVTDADSIVFFRRSDVISTGALYTPGQYPVIDIERGGSITGVIDGVFKVLELAIPDNLGDGGTMIIPGRGRMTEESDLGEYRSMLVIITERIRDLRSKGQTLEQIKASRPTFDYDTEYHATREVADRFVESIYRTMQPPPAKSGATAQSAGGAR